MLVVHLPTMNERLAIQQALVILQEACDKGQCSDAAVRGLAKELLRHERISWDARCYFCNGPSYPWHVDAETWLKVEPLLGQQQACFECFGAAWMIMGHNNGEPFVIAAPIINKEDG